MSPFLFPRIPLRTRLSLWLVGFVVVIVYAVHVVRSGHSLSQFSAPAAAPAFANAVDQSLYATARNLAAQAATLQEQQYAVAALRDADHELDQSFATAIRHATTEDQTLSGPALETLHRIEQLKRDIKSDEIAITVLQTEPVPAPENDEQTGRTDSRGQQLSLAQAQLALDNDELDNAQQELSKSGGDKRDEVQRAFDQHRGIESQASTLPKNTATAALVTPKALGTMLGKFRAHSSLKERRRALAQALTDADRSLAALVLQAKAMNHKAGENGSQSSQAAPVTHRERSAELKNLEYLSNLQKDMSDLDRRVRDLGQLKDVYARWGTLVSAQQKTIATSILGDMLSIVMALLGVFALSGIVQYLLNKWESRNHQRFAHTRVIAALALQILVVARVLVILFGVPEQIGTILGLVTAGITIALKDYLLSILGWFGLMGRKGIRVGDFVEIDGTQGEVIEITTLRTILLETGNWATDGHPTGRQAVFMNKFPFEHKYFNFSTAEQWMWDQIAITVPPGKEVTPEILAMVSRIVERNTWEDARKAKSLWNAMSREHGLTEFSVTPPVVIRSSPGGFELIVRYIVQAHSRFDTSVRLRQGVFGVLRDDPAREELPDHTTGKPGADREPGRE